VVDVGRDENGKRLQKWHSGFERRKDAERALTEILGRVESGAYIEPSKRKLYADLLAGGRNDAKLGEGLSPRSVRYAHAINPQSARGRRALELRPPQRRGLRRPAEVGETPAANLE
jgi:hypothetical protein